MMKLLRVGALLLAFAAPLAAQNLRNLPRANATTGVNDSALVLVNDSSFRTAATSTRQLFLRPAGTAAKPTIAWAIDSLTGFYRGGTSATALSCNGVACWSFDANQIRGNAGAIGTPTFSYLGDPNTGEYNFGPDTLGFTQGGVATFQMLSVGGEHRFRAAGPIKVQATGNSGTITLQTTTSGGSGKNTLVLGADTSATFLGAGTFGGNVTVNGATTAVQALTATTASLSTANVNSLSAGGWLTPSSLVVGGWNTAYGSIGYGTIPTGATTWNYAGTDFASKLQFNAGGFTFSTAPSGTAGNAITFTNVLTIAQTGAAVFSAGISATTGTFSAMASEGSTQNAVCITSGGVLQQNAAASCLVSSMRYKKNVAPLPWVTASRIVFGLHPVTFNYKADNKPSIGLIAEQADSVDYRLATRDAKGRINSINYEQITASLLLVVQRQQRQIDSLFTLVRSKP